MAGNFVAVKQDDRDVVAVALEKFWILRNIHDLDGKLCLGAATIDDLLRPVTQMATRLGVDRNQGHKLVAVMLGLVGAFDGNAEVVSLFHGELGELHADLFEVQAGHFFIKLLG